MGYTPTDIENQRRWRIRLAVAAYTYETLNESVMSDGEFDRLSQKIDPSVPTGNKKMDDFFSKRFDKNTGMWVKKHPDRPGLHDLYERYYKKH